MVLYVNTPVGETVNVREEASTNSNIVTTLSRGTQVYSDSYSNGWYHITSPVTGYIVDTFLSEQRPSTDTTVGTYHTSPKFKGRVITESGSLSVRDGYSTSDTRINTLAHNNTYYFKGAYYEDSINAATGWLLTDANNDGDFSDNTDGWVSAQYIAWENSFGTGDNMYGYITLSSGYLNLRQTPSTSAASIGKLYDGDTVLWLNWDYSYHPSWAHVATPVGTGWIKSAYIDRRG